MSSKTAMFNRPDIFEVMDLPVGATKVTCEMDSRVPNCGTFTIYLEDHTIGNLLRMQLLQDESVMFAAYQVPHPLENKIEIRIQATEASTPYKALYTALSTLLNHGAVLSTSFKKQIQDSKNRGLQR